MIWVQGTEVPVLQGNLTGHAKPLTAHFERGAGQCVPTSASGLLAQVATIGAEEVGDAELEWSA